MRQRAFPPDVDRVRRASVLGCQDVVGGRRGSLPWFRARSLPREEIGAAGALMGR